MPFRVKNGYWVSRWIEGNIRRSKAGFLRKRYALIYEYQQKLRIEQGLIGIKSPVHIDIEKFFEQYLKERKDHLKKKSYEREVSCIGIWREFFTEKGITSTRELDIRTTDLFKNWRGTRLTPQSKTPSKRTINLDLMTIRKIFNWGLEKEIISKNPFEKVELYKLAKHGISRFLTLDEIKIIEKSAGPHIRDDIFVLLRTGMRSGEMCALDIGAVDLDQKVIHIRVKEDWSPKAGKGRIVPIEGKELAKVLERKVNQAKETGREYLFTTSTGNRQTPDNLTRRFRNLMDQLGKQGILERSHEIVVHTLRRTYICHKVMAGEDPVKIMAIVGHEEWSTFQIYLSLSSRYVTEIKGRLPY